jgi:ferric-dicitrate binding protein FerR (iron transport regulator)
MFGAGLFFYKQQQSVKPEDIVAGLSDVDPGRLSATLTLADGKKIKLTGAKNGELAKQAGVVITKSADGQLVYEIKEKSANADQMNTLSTANGETYKVRLPDGSLVWLNSASSLTYSAGLNEDGKRRVSLTGEGYFEIAKDKAHPFVVKTASQEVEVLGTHFNINSYKDEAAVATTLLEGSVRVSGAVGQKVLKPGEQAINGANGIRVAKVDAENVVDWKDGDFYLNHLDYRTAMRKISRWYDVDIVYEKSVPADLEAGGWISRSTKLSLVLKMIESSGTVKFRVDGRTIYVSKP